MKGKDHNHIEMREGDIVSENKTSTLTEAIEEGINFLSKFK